jgi:hypothetical protein
MGAFSIAFDIIIVGALALPCVLLVIHLFFPDNQSSITKLLGWVKDQNQPAVAGVLLFAMTFSLGSAMSRIAQDFLDDSDLHIQVFGYLFRVGATETSIRTDVYCQTLERGTVTPKPSDPLAEKRKTFMEQDRTCQYTGKWIVQRRYDSTIKQWIDHKWINDQEDLAGDIFHVQEAAVLLKGADATERLRQFHDQIMVLRGATFNGMVAFSLCLFWWSANLRSRLRWAVPSVYLVLGSIALYNHARAHAANDPLLMEFTLLVLAAAGWYVLWPRTPKGKSETGKPAAKNGREGIRPAHLVLSLFLTFAAFLGWWSTQVLYDQQVAYSYKALSEHLAEPVTPSSK